MAANKHKFAIKLFVLLCFCFSISAVAQKIIPVQFINSTSLPSTKIIGKDAFGDFYFLNDNVFTKTSALQKWEYKNVALGKIHKVDILNPLQLVLLFKDFNAVVFLDNQLNETNRILGNSLETPISFEYTGLASGNQFWFYDVFSRNIGLFQIKNNSYRWLSTPLPVIPKAHRSNYNHYYWIDDTNTFYSINLFGKIKKLGNIPINELVFIINEKQILYLQNEKVQIYDVTLGESYPVEILEKSFDNFFFKDGILSIFTQNKITNYKIILP